MISGIISKIRTGQQERKVDINAPYTSKNYCQEHIIIEQKNCYIKNS